MQNKHIIRLSFLGVFLSIIMNIILYREFMIENVILREISKNNKHLVQTYNDNIWSLSSEVVKKFRSKGYESMLSDKDFIAFAKATTNFFRVSDALKVQIFDFAGNEFFSSSDLNIDITESDTTSLYQYFVTKLDYIIFKDVIANDPLTRAFRGEYVNSLMPKAKVINSDNNIKMANIIVNYIPIIGANGAAEALFVIYTDATEPWNTIGQLERKVFGAFLIIFTVFFIIIMYNTRYAQLIINRQYQVNKLLEEAKQKAEMENIAKTQFLANVSHELRTPLNAIIGFSEIILSEQGKKLSEQQYIDYVYDIHDSGEHLLSVINDILDYSKATADKLKVDMIEVDINKMVTSSMRFVATRAAESKIILIEDTPQEHVIIKADKKRLKQALLNLLSNAVKFTPENGSVTLSVSKNTESKLVYIRVIDTGIGMAEQDIPKALSSFGQVDNKLNRRYEGTGLGLPLTKKLIELMNGKFEITSQEGKGTTVTVTFQYEDEL